MSPTDHHRFLNHFCLNDELSIYSIGALSSGVTVRKQQIRALNLAYLLIENGHLGTSSRKSKNIAVVGAGFSGLTFVAALLKKDIACNITLFEEHDTLVPLQQGSDSRWLHPHIYDWPDRGSEADVSMLPIMNWTAARASDVAVQILREWKQTAAFSDHVTLYCNTRHLQLTQAEMSPKSCRIEWIGEPRNHLDGTIQGSTSLPKGSSQVFDLAVLAVGFGIEQNTYSYWRNETIGQPLLNQSHRTYLISGQGDGALIDLVRVRLSQYRQDRILEDLFSGKNKILNKLSAVKQEISTDQSISLFECFDDIFFRDTECSNESEEIRKTISRRLRRDTDVILKTKVPDIATLLDRDTGNISFQNALLTYLLYLVGGFAPSNDAEKEIVKKYSIPKEFIVRRHGTNKARQIRRICPNLDVEAIMERLNNDDYSSDSVSKINWPGGYFGYKGASSKKESIRSDKIRSNWRREYLPGPTTLVTATICSAIVGVIKAVAPELKHLRITMHRVLLLNGEELLQQTCDYEGLGISGGKGTRGRTFPSENAMIGLAYKSHRPVHTLKDASPKKIADTMAALGLSEAARKMAPDVSYILALPILQPASRYFPPSRVSAIVYLDSKEKGFSMTNAEVGMVANVVSEAAAGLEVQSREVLSGVRNLSILDVSLSEVPPNKEHQDFADVIEYLPLELSSQINAPFVMNFDYADPASTG